MVGGHAEDMAKPSEAALCNLQGGWRLLGSGSDCGVLDPVVPFNTHNGADCPTVKSIYPFGQSVREGPCFRTIE